MASKRNTKLRQPSPDSYSTQVNRNCPAEVLTVQKLRIFLFSGFLGTDPKLRELQEQAKALKNCITLSDSEYNHNCSHLICAKPSFSDKFLGACAAGTWVLVPAYINDSSRIGHWLPEAEYEWSDKFRYLTRDPLPHCYLNAPRKHRLQRKVTGKGAFADWTIVVHLPQARKKGYTKILKAGDAKIKECSAAHLADVLCTFVLIERQNLRPYHRALTDENLKFKFVVPDIIRNYLLMEEPLDLKQFHVRSYDPGKDPLTVACRKASIGGRALTDRDVGKRNFTANAMTVKSTVTDSKSKRLFDECHSVSSSCSPKRQKIAAVEISAAGTENCDDDDIFVIDYSPNTKPFEECHSVSSSCSPKRQKIAVDISTSGSGHCQDGDVLVIDASHVKQAEVITLSDDESVPEQTKVPEKCKKTKRIQIPVSLVREVYAEVNATEVDDFESYRWPHPLANAPDDVNADYFSSKMVETFKEYVLGEDIQDGYNVQDGIQVVMDSVEKAATKIPLPELLQILVGRILLNPANEKVVHLGIDLLHLIFSRLKPGVDFTQRYFLNSFCDSENQGSDSAWRNIVQMLDLSDMYEVDDEDTEVKLKGRRSLLKFVVRTLQMDFYETVKRIRRTENQSARKKMIPLIVRLVWPHCVPDCCNSSMQKLVKYSTFLLAQHLDKNCAEIKLMRSGFELLTLVARCCQEFYMLRQPKPLPILTNVADDLALAVKNQLVTNDYVNDGNFQECFEEYFQPCWLRMKVAEYLLLTHERVKMVDEALKAEPLSLRKIYKCYFRTLAEEVPESKSKCEVRKSCRRRTAKVFYSEEPQASNEPKVAVAATKSKRGRGRLDINKRDAKGETQLHRACKANRHEVVSELLRNPEVDVNAEDNAGWTPLHEACNHGAVESVRKLLNFKPPRKSTLPTFYGQGLPLNLVAKNNEEGMTPLHDAIVSGHLEIVRMLLEHGGNALLKEKDKNGLTPDKLPQLKTSQLREMRKLVAACALDLHEEDNAISSSQGGAEVEQLSGSQSRQACHFNGQTTLFLCRQTLNNYLTVFRIREIAKFAQRKWITGAEDASHDNDDLEADDALKRLSEDIKMYLRFRKGGVLTK